MLLHLAPLALLLTSPQPPSGTGGPRSQVSIANAGFEALYLGSNLPAIYGGNVPTGTFPTGPPPASWTAYYEGGSAPPGVFIGVINPGTAADYAPNPPYFEFGAPEGDNAVLLYTNGDQGGAEYGVEQDLGVPLRAGMTYTLKAAVGNIGSGTALLPPYSTQGFYNLDGFPGYRLQLLAGGVVIAEDVDGVRPAERRWRTATVRLNVTGMHPQLGQELGVRLINRNQPEVAGVSGIEVDFDNVRLEEIPTPGNGPSVQMGFGPFGVVLMLGGPAWFRILDRRLLAVIHQS